MRERSSGKRSLLAVPALLLVCAIPLAYQIFRPFVTVGDNNTAAFAQPARNFLRFGAGATKLGLATDMGEQGPPFVYNTHHPPLVAVSAAAIFLATGVHDWAARLYPAACTLGAALIFFLLWRRARGEMGAAIAVIVMATMPAFGHYGKMLGEEAPTLFWGLLAAWLYYRWKDAVGPASAPWLAASLAAYAAGCLNGWAAFHMGPILFVDAFFTLRGKKPARRAALAGFALVGTGCFLAAFGHILYLSGGTKEILEVAWGRLAAQGTHPPGDRSLPAWFAAEGRHFARMYGLWILLPAAAGLLSALAALFRRRVRGEGAWLLGILTAFGVAHPLIFRWAAYYHEWMLFHLMPMLALASGEGILLAGGLAARVFSRSRWRPAAAAIAAGSAIALLAAAGVSGTVALDEDAPGYAWPILGRELAAMTSEGSTIISTFPFSPLRSAALRFYADRRVVEADSLAQFQRRVAAGSPALFVRDLDEPLDPDLENALEDLPYRDVGMFRIHDLRGGAEIASGAGPAAGAPLESVPIEAGFGGRLRLTGYVVTFPSPAPPPRSFGAAFLGFEGGALAASRILRVTSHWRVEGAEPPAWKLITGVTRRGAAGGWLNVPSLVLPEKRAKTLAEWKGRSSFDVVAAFFPSPGLPPGSWELRFGLFNRGVAVPPEGASAGIKILVAGEIPLDF